ncbi:MULTISPECIES: DUF3311 domain-containing protein [Brevibacillus]|jgi:Protein of unknown function (DUF3311).|uniref:Membrane protein n=1 Tax=Brevibacillus parabrevis TaxID=54914 RepID=A0A4Y3PHS3_BREPA|nr:MULTISPECIES: DUF3311 domain-containing protein [Brevibacillus]TGV17884.1 DUF3311 domain-containing protein [Mesorhizobium sp. M00.F.Ca.ET.186.01.1.1]KZE55552.1 hypothetical protein AV540_05735 [Brevibacillus parabrevis]MBU8712267.1 DUF3311 domain-containing protein [Brevibacillus parabrevis]MDH6349338.1 hypothetical protein [Brevibacillus sp. 1238]MDR5001350.1 DUF3311 domain-containing protein [Brevibacillus parabrevis]
MKARDWLGVVPFIGMLGGVPFVNRVEPYVLGMPFVLFWIVLWVVLTSVIMAVIHQLDPATKEEESSS